MSSQKNAPRLPLHTCSDLFGKLQFDLEELGDDWSEYKTFNFVITAYHLYQDWISATGTKNQRRKREKLPEKALLLFQVWRDITNATKHWKLNKDGQSKQVVDSVSERQIADWHSYFIAGPVIYIEVSGAKPSFPELANATIQCFSWFLDDSIDTFPNVLHEYLERIFRPLRSDTADSLSIAD